MTARALKYAEDTLGVHSVYKEARGIQDQYARVMADLSSLFPKKRKLQSEISYREADIVVDERGKHPEHSQAALDRHLKIVYFQDDQLRQLRGDLLDIDGWIDEAEFRSRSYESQLRLLVARLEQLGGYLNYLAAVKTEQQDTKTTTETT